MRIFLSIDDTDNLESIGSGELLEIMGKCLQEKKLAAPSYITRHQLFVHEDIPYTSHNSAMCCEMELEEGNLGEVIEYAKAFLLERAAEGSDPGLCVVRIENLSPPSGEQLIEFGRKAKKEILTKEQAYRLAETLAETVSLSEHGGTGQGVIGALAGCGLRLSGNDGRLKGKIYPENAGNSMRVETLCAHYPFDAVRLLDGPYLSAEDKVLIGEELKGVFLDGKIVLPVKKQEGEPSYITCNKKELKAF